MPSTLFIIATPIGNLGDLSKRAVETLTQVDAVLAEDTRVTLRLLNSLGLKKKLYSYHEHSDTFKDDKVMEGLAEGRDYALVSDAGTPGISDPGARLVGRAVAEGFAVVPISGPSAVSTLVSLFGVPHTSYHFWGFFPTKKKRQRELLGFFATVPGIHVFFESPFRILETIEKHFLNETGWHMVVGREMTKQFETYYRGTPAEVLEAIKAGVVKGEFCVGVVKTAP